MGMRVSLYILLHLCCRASVKGCRERKRFSFSSAVRRCSIVLWQCEYRPWQGAAVYSGRTRVKGT